MQDTSAAREQPQDIAGNSSETSGRDSKFKFDEESCTRMSAILGKFQGSHNFHNYTVKVILHMEIARQRSTLGRIGSGFCFDA